MLRRTIHMRLQSSTQRTVSSFVCAQLYSWLEYMGDDRNIRYRTPLGLRTCWLHTHTHTFTSTSTAQGFECVPKIVHIMAVPRTDTIYYTSRSVCMNRLGCSKNTNNIFIWEVEKEPMNNAVEHRFTGYVLYRNIPTLGICRSGWIVCCNAGLIDNRCDRTWKVECVIPFGGLSTFETCGDCLLFEITDLYSI